MSFIGPAAAAHVDVHVLSLSQPATALALGPAGAHRHEVVVLSVASMIADRSQSHVRVHCAAPLCKPLNGVRA